MRAQAASSAPLANGRDAIAALKSKARSLKDTSLPMAASAAESAGNAISTAALSASRVVAKSLRGQHSRTHGKGAKGAALFQAAPFLKAAGRFAWRNPALLAAAGVAIAIIGYSAWTRREPDTTAPEAAE